MKKTIALALLSLSVSSYAAPFAKGRILVTPKEGLSDNDFDSVLSNSFGDKINKKHKKLKGLSVHLVDVDAGSEEATVLKLRKHPNIKFVEVDAQVKAVMTPNDTNFPSQWMLPKMQVPTAWDYATGAGITIAILDTGTDGTHPDLASKMVPGWNIVSNNSDTTDINGHGTMTAGVAAAAGNNGLGVIGVAYNSKIMPIRITNDPTSSAYLSDIANAINYAADHGAKVVNVSYGVCGSPAINSAAQYLRSKGGQLIASEGNDGVNSNNSQASAIICVSATDSSDVKTSWSTYGNDVTVSAPGLSILTTLKGGTYGNVSGTSFSSPATAGTMALIMSANPALSPAEAQNILTKTADDLGTPGYDTFYGYGRVNAGNAVASAKSVTPGDKAAPTVSITTPTNLTSVSGLVNIAVNANDNIGVSRVELFANGKLVATDTTAPYQFSWDSKTQIDGAASLVAYAFDAAGNKGSSQTINVTTFNTVKDTIAPVVTITSPVNNSAMKSTVMITSSATDNVKVVSMKIIIDGVQRASYATSSFNVNWNTYGVAYGYHTIQITASDAAGNIGKASVQIKK